MCFADGLQKTQTTIQGDVLEHCLGKTVLPLFESSSFSDIRHVFCLNHISLNYLENSVHFYSLLFPDAKFRIQKQNPPFLEDRTEDRDPKVIS